MQHACDKLLDTMDGRIVLHLEIIKEIKRRCAESSRHNKFSASALIDRLLEFLKENKAPLSEKLHRHFYHGKFPNKSTFLFALDREGEKCGATSELRDLLCFYAFGKNWPETIDQLGSTIEKEVSESERLRHKVKKTLSERDNILNEFLLNNERHYKEMTSKFDKLISAESAQKGDQKLYGFQNENNNKDFNQRRNLLLEKIRSGENKHKQIRIVMAINYLKLLILVKYQRNYQEIVKLGRNALAWKPDLFIVHAEIAESLYRLGRYYEALSHLDQGIRSQPGDATCLIMKVDCFFKMREFRNAESIIDYAIKLYANKRLYEYVWHINPNPPHVFMNKKLSWEGHYLELLELKAKVSMHLENFQAAIEAVDLYLSLMPKKTNLAAIKEAALRILQSK